MLLADECLRSLCEELTEAILCSRKSFFGGFVSTRSDAADPNFKPRPQPEPKAKPLQRSHAKPGSAKQQARKPAAKRARDTSDDFASLEDYDSQPAKASKPNGISKVCKQADGAPKVCKYLASHHGMPFGCLAWNCEVDLFRYRYDQQAWNLLRNLYRYCGAIHRLEMCGANTWQPS